MTTKRFIKYDGKFADTRTFGMTLADGEDNTIQTTIIPNADPSGSSGTSSVIKRSRFIMSHKTTNDLNANDTTTPLAEFTIPFTLTAGNLYKINANFSTFIHIDDGSGTLEHHSGTFEWQQIITANDISNPSLELIDTLVVTEKSASNTISENYIDANSFASTIASAKYKVTITTKSSLDLTTNSSKANSILDVELIELTESKE